MDVKKKNLIVDEPCIKVPLEPCVTHLSFYTEVYNLVMTE